MKKPLFILFLLSWGMTSLVAQMPHQGSLHTAEKKAASQQDSNKLYFLATESFPSNKKGRQFLNNEFLDGYIIDYEDKSNPVPLRYRVADDEMQIKHLGEIKALYPSKVKRITFKTASGDQVFVPVEYMEKDVKITGYFELMSEGNTHLLKMYQVKKEKLKNCYFIQKEGELAKQVKLKKSKVLNAFGTRKSKAAKYVAKEKLNLKEEMDVKKLFDYMNQK